MIGCCCWGSSQVGGSENTPLAWRLIISPQTQGLAASERGFNGERGGETTKQTDFHFDKDREDKRKDIRVCVCVEVTLTLRPCLL